jgi:hypothetical protein
MCSNESDGLTERKALHKITAICDTPEERKTKEESRILKQGVAWRERSPVGDVLPVDRCPHIDGRDGGAGRRDGH